MNIIKNIWQGKASCLVYQYVKFCIFHFVVVFYWELSVYLFNLEKKWILQTKLIYPGLTQIRIYKEIEDKEIDILVDSTMNVFWEFSKFFRITGLWINCK